MSTIVRKRSLSAAPSTSSPDWFFEFQKMQSPLSAFPVLSDFPLDVSEGEDDDSTLGEERPLLSLDPPTSFCTSASSITDEAITSRTASTASAASEKQAMTPPPPALESLLNVAALNYSLETKSGVEFTPNNTRNDASTVERGRSIRRERGRGSGVQHTAERIPIRPKPHNQVNNHSRSYQQKSNLSSFNSLQTDLQTPSQAPHPGVGYIRGIGAQPSPVVNPITGGTCPPSMGLMPPFGLLAFSPFQVFPPFGLPFVTPPPLHTAANTVDLNQKCVGPTQSAIVNHQNIISSQQPNNNIMNSSANPNQSYPLRNCTNTGRGVGGATPVASSRSPFHEFRANKPTTSGCGSSQDCCCADSCASAGSPSSSAIHANGNESPFCNTRIRHVQPSTWRHEPYPVDTPMKKTEIEPLPIADDGTLLGPLRPADVDPALGMGAVAATFTGELYTDRVVVLSPELPGDKQKQHKWVEISVNDSQEEPRKRRYRFSGVLPCGHRVFAKRLRFRRGWTYFMCVSCGFKWGESGAR